MFNRVIGIELGLLKSSICEVAYKSKSPHIYRCISFDTPVGSFYDGYIMNLEALASIIRDKIKEAGIKGRRLVFSFMSTKIANREVIIPSVKTKLIYDVVMANIEEYFPMSISEHAVTYSILERLTVENEKKLRLLVLAAPDKLVKGYYELAELLGYEIEAIDYMGNSSFQLVKGHINEEPAMVLHIHEQLTFLNIIEKGILSLSRVINYGYINIIDTLLDSYNGPTSRNEAMELINNFYYSEEAVAAADEGSLYLKREAGESLQYLSDNIGRILDYSARNENKRIGTIYIMGQAAICNSLKTYFAQELGLDIIYLGRPGSLVVKKKATAEIKDISDYLSCVGAAIQPVNFIPKDYLEKSIRSSNIYTIAFALSSGLIISTVLILVSFFSYRNERISNRILKTEISNLSSINEIYNEHNEVSERLGMMKTIYKLTVSNNDYFPKLLEDIEDNIPSRAIVDSINVSSELITLSLVTDSEVTAAKTLQQLKSIPGLKEVSTSSLSIAEDEYGLKNVSLVIDMKYKPDIINTEKEKLNIGEEG